MKRKYVKVSIKFKRYEADDVVLTSTGSFGIGDDYVIDDTPDRLCNEEHFS